MATKKQYGVIRLAIGFSLFLLCLSPGLLNGQQFFKITYGDLNPGKVSLTAFKLQKELMPPKGLTIDSATVYFQIPGEAQIISVDYIPTLDTIRFNKCISLLKPDSFVSFDNIVLSDSDNAQYTPHNLISYTITAGNAEAHKPSKSFTEIRRIQGLNYISGAIYFSGAGFRNVEVVHIQNTKPEYIKEAFGRCKIGTKINLENVYYRDEQNKIVGPFISK